MFEPEQNQLIEQTARTTQIIAFALISGVILFAFVILLAGLATDDPPETPVISIVGFVFAAGAVLAAPIVSKAIASAMRRSAVEGNQTSNRQYPAQQQEFGTFGIVVGSFQVGQIFRRAILEGAAFMNLVAYIIEAQPLNLAIAIFLVLTMMFSFPTRDNLERFVREQMDEIEQLKVLEG